MESSAIVLSGSPAELGLIWGQINGADVRDHMEAFYATARQEHGLDETTLLLRARVYEDMIADLAPHWHEEALALATAAGVDAALYNAFLAGRYRGLLFREECTSYAAVGSASADRRPLFHKNRDNRMRPQAFYRKHTHAPGLDTLPYLAVGDTSDTGVMMMVNAAGLAGSADMGGADPSPRHRGLMNPYGLRLIAETADTCAEALEIVRGMNDLAQYAGGTIATRWSFADRFGRALVALNTHDAVIIETDITDGIAQSCPREGLAELLQARCGKLTAGDFNAASRLPGVCAQENCSSLTALIDPDQPESFTCAWAALGRAVQAPYLPLFMGADATPREYIDGTAYRWYETGPEPEQLESFERQTNADCAAAQAGDEREALADVAARAARLGRETWG